MNPSPITVWSSKCCWILLVLASLTVSAQYPELNWAKNSGSTSTDNGIAVTSDAVGNVYVTGFFAGTVDFDPGASITNLTSSGSLDIFVTKFDAGGNLVWAKKMGGNSSDIGKAIAVDAVGNVYLTGYFSTTADFDPGTGINNLTSVDNWDIFVCKLDVNGDFVWAGSMGGISFDIGEAIALDASNNPIVTGSFSNIGDFDPGPGITAFTGAGLDDIFMVKLNGTTGSLTWAKQIGSIGGDQARGITVDASDNILATGVFGSTVDFDPGVGTFPLAANGNDVFVLKLNTNGDFVWAAAMGGNNSDVGVALKVDALGNVYSTGYFVLGNGSPHDFDPGAGVFNLTPVPDGNTSNKDIYVSKLSATGAFLWAKQLGGVGTEEPFALALDASGNVYTSGIFSGTADFDPGSSAYSFTASGFSNIYISKLNVSGDFVWAEKPGGSYSGFGRGIAVDNTNQVIVTGSFDNTVDFSAGACDFSLTTNGQSDIFLQKLSQSGPPPPTITSFTPVVGLAGTVVTITGINFDPTSSNNTVKFNGTTAVVTASTSTSITTSVPIGATSGFITVDVVCASGVSSNPYAVATCVPISQKNALFELYNTTYGANWTDNANWLSADESTWFGVTVSGCDITEIKLPSNNLNGYLPAEMGDLTGLKLLDLSDNQLYEGIPPELSNLTDLQYLYLQGNQLQYDIPPALSNLPSLIEASLGSNRFSGTAPAIGLASMSLSDVSLESNFLNGLDDITGYYNLTSFSIGSNLLTFEDLEPNAAVSGFTYSPQAKLPPGGIISYTVGGSLTIPFTTPGTANSYQWYKNGALIPGATSATLSIPSTTIADAGTYYVLVDNSIAIGVTLQSLDYVVIADPCTSGIRTSGFIDSGFNPAFDTPANAPGVALQSSGKIIVAVANNNTVGGVPVYGTIRFNADGTLDNTFNQIPEITIPLIQPDDKILGYANDQVIRFNADGTDDFSFNNNAPQSYSSSLYAMALQPDGKIVYSFEAYMGTQELSRLNADGTSDPSFPPISILASALEVQSDGKILVGSTSGFLSRLNADGSTDFSFNVGFNAIQSISDLLVQPDGKIIMIGKFTSIQGSNRFGIVRLNTDGSIDPSFIAQGISDLTTLGGPNRVALMSNGKLIVAGDFANVNGSQKKNLVRLNSDGTVDCSFDPGLSTNVSISSIAIQPDNKILISGGFTLYDGASRNGLARVNISGATLTINLQPVAVTVCVGSTDSFITSANGTTNITYQWQYSSTVAGTYSDIANGGGYSNATTASLTVNSLGNFGAGFYRCKINGDLAATVFTNSAQLTINPIPPTPATTGANRCGSGSMTLNASGGAPGQYKWYPVSTGGTAIVGEVNATYITPSLTSTTTYFVSLTVSSCESARAPVTATILTTGCAPVITAQTLVTQLEGKIEINLEPLIATSGTLDPSSIKIITQPASGAIATITNFLLSIDYKGKLFSGKESVTIEACNTSGFCSQQSFDIEVAGNIIVYNAVSPNGDDKNPFLFLQYIDVIPETKTNRVIIFNRWGDEVFSVSDYDNKTKVFIGLTHDGSKLPAGTYFYKIELPLAGKSLSGFIDLKY